MRGAPRTRPGNLKTGCPDSTPPSLPVAECGKYAEAARSPSVEHSRPQGRTPAMTGLIRRQTAPFLTLWMLALACPLTIASAAQQPAATKGPPDSIRVLAGVFRAGKAHDIVIAPFR